MIDSHGMEIGNDGRGLAIISSGMKKMASPPKEKQRNTVVEISFSVALSKSSCSSSLAVINHN